MVEAERKLFAWSAGPAERVLRSWSGAEGNWFERASTEAASAGGFTGSCCQERRLWPTDEARAFLACFVAK